MTAPPLDTAPPDNPPPGAPPADTWRPDTAPPDNPPPETGPRVLRRCPHRRVIGGVAAGLAEYLDVDAGAVRIALVAFAFIGGLALPLYVAAWLLIPEEEADMSVAEDLFARRDRY